MRVAEVVERNGGRRLRLGFSDGGGVLADAGGLDAIEPGSFVEVTGAADSLAVASRDGAPVIVALAGTALAGVYAIAARLRLRWEFSPEVMTEVAAFVSDPGIDDPSLVGMTDVPFVTIDYETSRDLDQAVYVERRGDRLALLYALADGAHFVRPGSALFDEAMARGASFYLPGLTIPMLPRELSEGLCSLNEGQLRRALVFDIEIDPNGRVVSSQMVRARVRSRRKLTYDGVQEYFDAPSGHPLEGQEFTESLRLMGELGELRIEEADRRDVVRYDRVSVQLSLPSGDAKALAISAEPRNDVQKWNEQISLVTNIEGAKFLTADVDESTGFAGLFRVHQGPDDRDRKSLSRSIDDMVDELGLPDFWRWDREGGEPLASYVERLPSEGAGFRLARALQRQAMVMGRPSFFGTEPGPHYGIGAAAYARFSSPMREIVGIVTMHLAFHQMAGTSSSAGGLSKEIIEAAAEAGNRSKLLQKRLDREANKLAIDQLFASELDQGEDVRPVRSATVMGVTATKIYLALDDPPIEVKLYVSALTELLGVALAPVSDFEIGGDGIRIRVGDAIDVRLSHLDRDADHWILTVVGSPRRMQGDVG